MNVMRTGEAVNSMLRSSYARNLADKVRRVEKRQSLPNTTFIGNLKGEENEAEATETTLRKSKAAEVEAKTETPTETRYFDEAYQPIDIERYEDSFML